MSALVPGLVSVVLPCYDAEAFVDEAVASLLGQSYDDLEVLALDDGSTDGTRVVLERYAARDPRVRVLAHDVNRGLIPTLNLGMAEARGEFIARMDADDVALPHRIQRQVAFLTEHPDVAVVGSSADFVDIRGRATGRLQARCLHPGAVRFMVAFANPIVHPTLLARAGAMTDNPYGVAPRALHTEDYDLFSRMVVAGLQLANVPDVLLKRRVHPGGVSLRHENTQSENFVACSLHHLEQIGGLQVEPAAHRVLVNRMDAATTPGDLRAGLSLLGALEARFRSAEPSAADEIRGIADEQRVDILIQALRRGSTALRLAALALLPVHAGSLLSGRGRAYLASKLVR